MIPGRSILLMTACLAVLLSGCQTPPAVPQPRTSFEDEFDPCAEQLHDLCGSLLLYFSTHHQLPPRLSDLGRNAPLTCPASRKLYVYSPQGVFLGDREGRLILYDAEPTHSKRRWGILAESLAPGKPLVVHVVRVPEGLALRALPASQPEE